MFCTEHAIAETGSNRPRKIVFRQPDTDCGAKHKSATEQAPDQAYPAPPPAEGGAA
jgi:hypothetical protein